MVYVDESQLKNNVSRVIWHGGFRSAEPAANHFLSHPHWPLIYYLNPLCICSKWTHLNAACRHRLGRDFIFSKP